MIPLETEYRLSDFESTHPRLRDLLTAARRVATAESSLLMLGETGTGKEWLARAIHSEGPRAAGPFVPVNVAAIPDTLLESELFGHEKGAFTGALRAHRGHFERAEGGTLFLDEIGDMSPMLQAKLLRALQDRRIQRLGGEVAIPVDVRLMAATNQNLEKAMAAGKFRADLFYRLAVVVLTIPPLRERPDDVETLVHQYLVHFQRQLGRPLEGIEGSALTALRGYSWPGNVRELINLMERTVLLASGPRITLRDLPPAVSGAPTPSNEGEVSAFGMPSGWQDRPWKDVRLEALQDLERRYLDDRLRRTGGRIADTARLAGITPRALHQKMKALGLRKDTYSK